MGTLRRQAPPGSGEDGQGVRFTGEDDSWVHVTPHPHAPRLLVWVEAADDQRGAELVDEWTGRIMELSRAGSDLLAGDGSDD